MSTHCAKCKTYVCRRGRREAAPADCPVHRGFPDFEPLYSDPRTKRMAYPAALVEAVFSRAARAPVTALVARDERFCHNPAAALYRLKG